MKKKIVNHNVYHLVMMLLAHSFIVGCKNDFKELDVIHPETPEITEWVEPYHLMNGSMEDVKHYMSSAMPEYVLTKEEHISVSSLLVYQFDSTPVGIVYSFDPITGGLFSVVSTIHTANWNLVHECIESHYINLETDQDESVFDQVFTDEKHSFLITTMKYGPEYFTVSYVRVTK